MGGGDDSRRCAGSVEKENPGLAGAVIFETKRLAGRFGVSGLSAVRISPASVMPAIMVVTMHRDKYREASRKGNNGQGDDNGREYFLHADSLGLDTPK